MARELKARDAKLIQYLNEAYGKERQLETALTAHIAMTNRSSYKKRLQQHLSETKGHARGVAQRIRQLGGKAETAHVPGPEVVSQAAERVQDVAQRGVALAQGQLHTVRGTGEQEKLLKNAKTEFANEAEEIANYTAIESLAQNVGDRETAQLARGIRREEERMAGFLERLIPQLTKAVAQAEIPAAERNGAGRRRSPRRRTPGRRAATSRAGSRASSSRSTGRASSSRSTSRSRARGRTTAARKTSAKSSSGRARTSRRSSGTRSRRTTAKSRS